MESCARMNCVLKVDLNCETCRMKVMKVMQALCGDYSVSLDGEKGMVNISGRVINPSMVLRVFDQYNKHGEVPSVKFNDERPGPYHYPHGVYGCSSYPLMGGPELPWFGGSSYHHIPPPALPIHPPPPPYLMAPPLGAPPGQLNPDYCTMM
ncbi:hypothetical protein SLEP1_g29673 [Rubroshorea leprosula]|uniref:HMA domain-containing protein n=1 Tax=Rubroshorea leprosula TaxID=152421 RepID=A0AAV5K3U3_9ROSI|nr:hypothetical protein SLEP1_g29673 [Rubroshorea leprosula]